MQAFLKGIYRNVMNGMSTLRERSNANPPLDEIEIQIDLHNGLGLCTGAIQKTPTRLS